MRTTDTQVKIDIERYTNAGYTIEQACKQVSALYLGRKDDSVQRVRKELNK